MNSDSEFCQKNFNAMIQKPLYIYFDKQGTQATKNNTPPSWRAT